MDGRKSRFRYGKKVKAYEFKCEAAGELGYLAAESSMSQHSTLAEAIYVLQVSTTS
jgi:hypothetical protein